MCFYYDDCVESISHRETVRLRRKDKVIRCDGFCGKFIRKGDLYSNHEGLSSEGAYSYGVCCECDFMRNEIVLQEMASGCNWNEAWCPLEELQNEIEDRKLVRQSFEFCQERFRLLKTPRKKRQNGNHLTDQLQ